MFFVRDAKKNADGPEETPLTSQVTVAVTMEREMDLCFCIRVSQRLCGSAAGDARAEVQLLKNVTAARGYRGYTDTTWGQNVTGQVELLAFVAFDDTSNVSLCYEGRLDNNCGVLSNI